MSEIRPNPDDERARRALEVLAMRGPPFRLEDFCFEQQLEAIRDPARFKTECCSRRAGKTVGGAADLTDTALEFPNTVSLYLTLSRLNAKRIIWPDLLEINTRYQLGAQVNETELCLTFPNRSRIFLSGAKDKTEIEKFRGLALKKVRIDEAQAFRAYLQELVDDVLAKALYDHDGTLILSGTPGPVPAGYFYACIQNKEWAHFAWTMFQNPHLQAKSGKSPAELVAADCRRMGVTLDHPKIQRECFGRWALDPDSLVFRWTDQNHYDELPKGKTWEYVIGVDLGWSDADAIAVLGWCETGPEVYLVEEWVRAKSGITELATELVRLNKQYQPLAMVMDTAGLGTKIAEECRLRHGLPVEATKKTEKFAHIELLNDAMRTRRMLAKRESRFAQDCHLVEWDMDRSTGDRMVVAETFHSDICDAVLYAFRSAQGWLHEPPAPRPKAGTPEYFAAEEARMVEAAELRLQRQIDMEQSEQEPDGWGDKW